MGLNCFEIEEEQPKNLLRVNPAIGEGQKKRLESLKARRDGQSVASALTAVEVAAKGQDNLVPPILQAVKAYATIGEICHVLREMCIRDSNRDLR